MQEFFSFIPLHPSKFHVCICRIGGGGLEVAHTRSSGLHDAASLVTWQRQRDPKDPDGLVKPQAPIKGSGMSMMGLTDSALAEEACNSFSSAGWLTRYSLRGIKNTNNISSAWRFLAFSEFLTCSSSSCIVFLICVHCWTLMPWGPSCLKQRRHARRRNNRQLKGLWNRDRKYIDYLYIYIYIYI